MIRFILSLILIFIKLYLCSPLYGYTVYNPEHETYVQFYVGYTHSKIVIGAKSHIVDNNQTLYDTTLSIFPSELLHNPWHSFLIKTGIQYGQFGYTRILRKPNITAYNSLYKNSLFVETESIVN